MERKLNQLLDWVSTLEELSTVDCVIIKLAPIALE